MRLAIYMAMILVLPCYVIFFSVTDVINHMDKLDSIPVITSSTKNVIEDNYSDRQVKGFWYCSSNYGTHYYQCDI